VVLYGAVLDTCPLDSPQIHICRTRAYNFAWQLQSALFYDGMQDMQSIMSTAVMRWWPDQMVPMHRPAQAIADAKVQWDALHLYEPFDITQQVATKYRESIAVCLDDVAEVCKQRNSTHTVSDHCTVI
jgi:hypothetical protein